MPKTIGTQTLDLNLIRSIANFSVTVGPAPGSDYLDVQPVIERRDKTSANLVETLAAPPARFSEAELRALLDAGAIPGLPNYDTLRTGLATLIHTLLDTRP